MTHINDGGPAFPHEDKNHSGEYLFTYSGLTKREYFAGISLPQAIEDYDRKVRVGNLASGFVLPYATKLSGTREEIIARQACRYADALIAALAQGGE